MDRRDDGAKPGKKTDLHAAPELEHKISWHPNVA